MSSPKTLSYEDLEALDTMAGMMVKVKPLYRPQCEICGEYHDEEEVK